MKARRQNMLWKWCHFQTHFSRIKMFCGRGFEGLRKIQIFFAKCKCIFLFRVIAFSSSNRRSNMAFIKSGEEYSITQRENYFYVCQRERKEIFIFLCMVHEIYFQSVIMKKTCEDDMLSIFPSSATWKCIFPKRSIFSLFIFLLISTSQTIFLPFLLETLPFLCLFLWSWSEEKSIEWNFPFTGYMLSGTLTWI